MRWLAALAVCALATGARADWGARRDPFDAGVVQRLKAILAKNPHDGGALRQLVAMYKQHRTIAKLEAEYRAQAEDWTTLVVLARLPRPHAEAAELWKRAVAANPNDAHAWLAAGDAATTDAVAARDAYRRAATLATGTQKRVALTKLIAAARRANDIAATDAAYGELIALAPKDGMLWLDRGNAQLAAKQAAKALESFGTAESLLRTDPSMRLTATVNQGLALEALGRTDDAIAVYERVLDTAPRGYYLVKEVAERIVDVDRKRKQLPVAIARLEKRWPERSRGYFEWALLGDLYSEAKVDALRVLDAYRRALAKAPTEVGTHKKLIALLESVRPADALAAHEAAARIAPGDVDLQIQLAKRYRPARPQKALEVLMALSRRSSRNASARTMIAEVYEEWDEPRHAIVEYTALEKLEPREIEHVLRLGDAYWRIDEGRKAITVWARVAKIGTAEAFYRQAEVLAHHDLWELAALAYTKSLELDATNADAWYGRARAHEGAQEGYRAAEDARRAVALIAGASYADGLRNRQFLVRALHTDNSSTPADLERVLATWKLAFEAGEAAPGYLLLAHHVRTGNQEQQHDVLVKLYARAATDDSLGIAVARSYSRRKDFDRARTELQRIAQRTPARAEDIKKELAFVENARLEHQVHLEEEREAGRIPEDPTLVGREHRIGMRLEVGGDVRSASSALLGLGVYRTYGIARATEMALRIDWTQRDDDMEEVNTFGVGVGLARRILDTQKLEMSAGIGSRVELRYGNRARDTVWNRGALAGDVTVELLPRAIPATLGLRFHQSLTDSSYPSTVLVELGFEIR